MAGSGSTAEVVVEQRDPVIDIVVDIRVGSPTFGQWDAVELSAANRKALYISEGLGHAFCALTDDATVG